MQGYRLLKILPFQIPAFQEGTYLQTVQQMYNTKFPPKSLEIIQKDPDFQEKLLPTIEKIFQAVEQFNKERFEINLLVKGTDKITLTAYQVYQLLSLSFLNLIPDQNNKYLPNPNNCYFILYKEESLQKLKCLLNYFYYAPIQENFHQRKITYHRFQYNQGLHIRSQQEWEHSKLPLKQFKVIKDVMENNQQCILVDFANKYIGGGVLSFGCVQEEIMFIERPEALASLFFTERMQIDEAVFIQGAVRFSHHIGYAKDFEYRKLDNFNQNQSILAIDAHNFHFQESFQFKKEMILREINKAYIGFGNIVQEEKQSTILTGKWGCGAFAGEKVLKTLIQILAYSQSNHEGELIFSTFGDVEYEKQFKDYYEICKKYKTVGILCQKIMEMNIQNGENILKYLLK
ncbi:hypothetical protein pb186bvf_004824 [Paramecium bursaria]